jgi:hypothetical protein
MTHSKYHCTTAHITTSLHCRTSNCQLNSFASSIICQLPDPELLIQFSAAAATSSHLSSHSSALDCQYSTDSFNVTTLLGPNRKHRFQQYRHCCMFTDSLLINWFFCCVHVHFRGNLLPSRCLAANYSGFQASCHTMVCCLHHLARFLLVISYSEYETETGQI